MIEEYQKKTRLKTNEIVKSEIRNQGLREDLRFRNEMRCWTFGDN